MEVISWNKVNMMEFDEIECCESETNKYEDISISSILMHWYYS